ncbi:electroneutral sodium bicarbonate exchanger 1 isoform X3 [Folsomia candida]|uniref:electroneutral sodium bicarbonate exchanger 1 isoform X3 n=1 Tax=Folsomia candida TaxID=158441 RepID=UPI00160512FA|nr:electroneutral sodium bicarbonate exchanger 1 isoform X3 [Folsomia candida]
MSSENGGSPKLMELSIAKETCKPKGCSINNNDGSCSSGGSSDASLHTTQSFPSNGLILGESFGSKLAKCSPWVMERQPTDEEAPKDPGAQATLQNFSEKDFDSHRAHTVFVGVHVPGQETGPGGHRRRSHHRRHRHHRTGKDEKDDDRPPEAPPRPRGRLLSISQEDGQAYITPPAQRVQFILGEEEDDGTHESHPLFSEMEELVQDGGEMEWKETARWIKFEEDVEEGGNRWSKPHVATLSLHSLFELRSLLLNNIVMLDMEALSLDQIADLILDNMISSGHLEASGREKVREALLRRHRHLHEKGKNSGANSSSSNMSRLPIIRSLAEIGKSHSSSKIELTGLKGERSNSASGADLLSSSLPNKPLGRFLSIPGTGATNVPHVESATSASGVVMDRSPSGGSLGHNNESGSNLQNGDAHLSKGHAHFMRKIPQGAEASNILVGEVDFLDKPLSAFIRLSQSVLLGDLTEVPVPTRFLFVLLGPMGGISRYHEVGRAMATLMSDEVFHDVAYKARNRGHLLAGVDEFLDAVTVLPPGEWDPSIRIEPPAAVPSQDPRKRPDAPKEECNEEEQEQKLRFESGLTRTGRLFGGLMNDIKRKVPWYWSDFKDALSSQCLASWLFLYFACLTPIITFGGLLGKATNNNMAAIESLVSGFVCGIGYGLFSGQPLTILGSTGPVLVFESILMQFCESHELNYLEFRLWIGVWVAVILVILVALDASAFVCYITRFTEENFATLIALIFMVEAVKNVKEIGKNFPVNDNADTTAGYFCQCVKNESITYDIDNSTWEKIPFDSCVSKYQGILVGEGCRYYPDVFFLSVLLFVGTFLISIHLKDFKTQAFFPTKVRMVISDFAVIIAILSMSIVDMWMGLRTPKLQVPERFEPTIPTRGWVINPFGGNPFWTIIVAPLPALLATILIFMDQQITAVIINRKEHKLNKGCGYHLDLFVLSILIAVCSIMGIPWFVAATVLSMNHVNSLKMESESAAPGEKPQFLGVREQRVTHLAIFLMIGLSVLLTPLLKHIPMPVLYGVFLYMGFASLKGMQFFDRILIMFMPTKYQPDYMFLRQVPLMRVHMFTMIQLACLIMLWLIKSFRSTSILFPLMLVVMIVVRKLLDFVFSQRELKILDDVMPETSRRDHAEDDDWEEDGTAMSKNIGGNSSGNFTIPLANGNVMKIPVSSVNITEEVNRTGIWKTVNNVNAKEAPVKDGKNKEKCKDKGARKRGNKKDALTEEESRRLSTMNEEEEEAGGGGAEHQGVTIKIINSSASNSKTNIKSETVV